MSKRTRHPNRLGRYRSYDPPPAGFDPNTAPDAVLLRYGLPRRPDPEKEPDLARVWTRLFARPLTYLKAELQMDNWVLPNNPNPAQWAGALLYNQTGPPIEWVFAEWVIPEVTNDEPFWEGSKVAFWVGIDGAPGADSPNQSSILQAGVAARLTTSWNWGWWPPGYWPRSVITWWAWTEWYPDAGSAAIRNFPVEPGQTVSFVVCAPQPGDVGSVFVRNASTGDGASILVNPPEGVTSQGASAEWVVEKMDGSSVLLQFNPVTFNDCLAGTSNGVLDLEHAITENIWNMLDFANPKVLTDAEIELPNSVTVNWLSSD